MYCTFYFLLYLCIRMDFWSEIKLYTNSWIQFSARAVDGMKASYEMKLFGNLMRYGIVNSDDLGTAKSKLNYLDLLIWLANEKSIDFRKNIKFIDASFTIPTAIGMPLRMRVEGTASVQLQIDGKADLRQVMTKPRSIDINGAIKPR